MRILKMKDPSYIGPLIIIAKGKTEMAVSDRIALVTGANKGIGFQIVRQLAMAGVSVILGARDAERRRRAIDALAAEGLMVQGVEIDLLDPGSIAAAAEQIAGAHGRLDILVNNAAVADDADGPPSTVPAAVVRRLMETNFLGAFEVTRAMLPLLRRSPAGRIVNLSSPLGSMAVAADPASPFHGYRLLGYCASKAAVNLLTLQLASELRDTAITVNAVVPGFVRTDLTHGEGQMTPEEGARLPVEYALLQEAVTGRFVSPLGDVAW